MYLMSMKFIKSLSMEPVFFGTIRSLCAIEDFDMEMGSYDRTFSKNHCPSHLQSTTTILF